MDQLQREMNRLFGLTQEGRVFNSPSYPAVNIWTNDDGMLISAELPGVNLKDIDINVTADGLSLSGIRNPDGPIEEETHYHRRERSYGTFSRTIQLPFMVDTEKAEARFRDGVLQIALPRAEADRPRTISIHTE
jgi:HSP20 family protein